MSYNFSPRIVTNGLVLYLDGANSRSYPTTGTTWTDLSRSGFNGTLTNGPTFSSLNGGSIVFDGINDFVTGSTFSKFAFGTGDFTVSYWININAFTGVSTTPSFVDLRLTNNGNGYSDYVQSNKFKLYWGTSDKYISTSNINQLIWYNISSSRISNTISVYINGVLDGTIFDSTNLTNNGFRLGRNVNTLDTSYFNGKMSQVLIYNRGLSASEILQNYNTIKTRYI